MEGKKFKVAIKQKMGMNLSNKYNFTFELYHSQIQFIVPLNFADHRLPFELGHIMI